MASFEHIAQRLVGGPSVPSIGGAKPTTLDAALARVGRAEAELATARSEARRLGRLAGKKLSTLFEDSLFVKRSSAEEWMSEQYSAGFERACGYFEKAFRPASEKAKDPFHNVAQAMVGRGVAGRNISEPAVSEFDAIQQRIRASREVDLSSNRNIGAPTDPTELAAAIHKAAARAKSPTDSDPPLPMDALAKAVLAAGKKRRMEDE